MSHPHDLCSSNWLLMSGRGMVKGAVKTSELLFHGSEYAKQHIAPEGVRVVDPKVENIQKIISNFKISLALPGPGWSGDCSLGEHRGVSCVWVAGQ